jgi:hypothetical protein
LGRPPAEPGAIITEVLQTRHGRKLREGAQRVTAAKALAVLQVEKASVEGQRKVVEADLGPVRYFPMLLGADSAADRIYLWLQCSSVDLALAPCEGHTTSLRTYGGGSHAVAQAGATRDYFPRGRQHTGPSRRVKRLRRMRGRRMARSRNQASASKPCRHVKFQTFQA